MRVLITGGAGYLGSILSRKLLSKGYQVRVLDALWYGNESIKELDKDVLSINDNNSYSVVKKFTPIKSKETTKIEGTPDEISEQLVDVLKNKLGIVS